ncbi:NAD(P)H-dependent oxidoreductase [Agromyces sp. MMS24-JH15]|uniref:NAD(P)H-dependent oxidoreductase n=1 Tax=Agromyces sp. MMS24-JH15 TaxID=3243765 RepID=UPI003749AAA7
MRRILLVIGTPLAGSYVHALADAYAEAARAADAEVRVADLATVRFPHDPADRGELRVPSDGGRDHLDPAIRDLQDDVAWADHLVFVYPQWWGTYPAALSAYIDRVYTSGFAFRYGRGHVSEPLLAGRTARILMTMDSPGLWNRLVYRNASETSLSRAVLRYCGVQVRGITRLPAVRFSTADRREAWLARAGGFGAADAAAAAPRTARVEPLAQAA